MAITVSSLLACDRMHCMCGRFTLRTPMSKLIQQFELDEGFDVRPRYNVAPTQNVAAVRKLPGEGARHLVLLRWGLIPSWAKDPNVGSKMINARADGIAEKPSFRTAFKRRRCLVLADGYYEWQVIDDEGAKSSRPKKQPFYITMADERPFAFAGLWEYWEGSAESKVPGPLETCTIITTDANAQTSSIHHRMPVILPPEAYDEWLDPAVQDKAKLEPLLVPLTQVEMKIRPVSTLVNNVRNDVPACVETQQELF